MSSWLTAGLENAPSQHTPISLPVQGRIPSWLSGSLYRTGPGTFRVQSTSSGLVNISHWFDGLGMNHHFHITPAGEVYYSNRSSADSRTKEIEQLGYVPGITFGGTKDPCKTLFSKFFTQFVPSAPNLRQISSKTSRARSADGANVSVTLTPNLPGLSSHNANSSAAALRYLVAKTDANLLQIIDPETLQPLELVTYARLDPRLNGDLSAAHSCTDPDTGEFFNYVQKFGPTATYKVFKVVPSDNNRVHILAEITDAPMAYIHSFALTKKYVVLSVWQSDYGLNGASIKVHGNLVSSMNKWDPKRDTVFYVIDRSRGGVVAKYKAPTFFTFHTINAYDTSDDIILDLTCYTDNTILNLLYLDHLRSAAISPTTGNPLPIALPHARRYILGNILSQASDKAIVPRDARIEFEIPLGVELPTIHPAKYGSPYRYAYGIHRASPDTTGVFADQIIKLDLSSPNKQHKSWGARGYTTGEPIFIPRPNAHLDEEDDGVVLSVVLDGERGRSMLVVLDAKEMKEVARAEMMGCFPLGFHGVFRAKL